MYFAYMPRDPMTAGPVLASTLLVACRALEVSVPLLSIELHMGSLSTSSAAKAATLELPGDIINV